MCRLESIPSRAVEQAPLTTRFDLFGDHLSRNPFKTSRRKDKTNTASLDAWTRRGHFSFFFGFNSCLPEICVCFGGRGVGCVETPTERVVRERSKE